MSLISNFCESCRSEKDPREVQAWNWKPGFPKGQSSNSLKPDSASPPRSAGCLASQGQAGASSAALLQREGSADTQRGELTANWPSGPEELCLSRNHNSFSGLLVTVVVLGPSLVLITSLDKLPGCSLSLSRKLPRCLLLQGAVQCCVECMGPGAQTPQFKPRSVLITLHLRQVNWNRHLSFLICKMQIIIVTADYTKD